MSPSSSAERARREQARSALHALSSRDRLKVLQAAAASAEFWPAGVTLSLCPGEPWLRAHGSPDLFVCASPALPPWWRGSRHPGEVTTLRLADHADHPLVAGPEDLEPWRHLQRECQPLFTLRLDPGDQARLQAQWQALQRPPKLYHPLLYLAVLLALLALLGQGLGMPEAASFALLLSAPLLVLCALWLRWWEASGELASGLEQLLAGAEFPDPTPPVASAAGAPGR